MSIEIERKFLVKGEFKHLAKEAIKIKQAYLSSNPQRAVRIRIQADKAYLTVKGVSDNAGLSRYEWEKEIDIKEAEDLFLLCEPGKIEKARYVIPAIDGLVWEVDEFFGVNKGLIIAEIELPNLNTQFDTPDWIGEEVTGIDKYYNAYLSKCPYEEW